VRNYRITMQPSLYLAQAALLTSLHRKDVLGAFGPVDLITWTSNITKVMGGMMDRVFVEELAGINAAKNGGILSNPFIYYLASLFQGPTLRQRLLVIVHCHCHRCRRSVPLPLLSKLLLLSSSLSLLQLSPPHPTRAQPPMLPPPPLQVLDDVRHNEV
jgi:hypothetical protein